MNATKKKEAKKKGEQPALPAAERGSPHNPRREAIALLKGTSLGPIQAQDRGKDHSRDV